MKWLNGYGMRFVFFWVVFCSIFAVPKLLAGQAIEASDNDRLYPEVIITIAGHEHRYQPRPELGYVVVAQDDSDAIASVYRDLSLFTQNEIKSVGGRARQGLWIVESRQSAPQNEAVIKTLSVQRQIQYVAPLFSCNGEKEAVIPEIVVRVTAGTEQKKLEQICQMLSLRIKRRMMFTEQEYLVDVSGENADAVLAALIELNQIESVEWAAPNVITQPRLRGLELLDMESSAGTVRPYNPRQNYNSTASMPDDEYFPMQWHLQNIGQSGGTPGADINALEAWEITAGDPNIVICLHDLGVDLYHPDLVDNLVPGYDFFDNDSQPYPLLNSGYFLDAHGTACGGLVAAKGNNGLGVVGVAWNCKVMPVRDSTSSSSVSVAKIAEAIRWSAAHGADVMSYSWGYESPQPVIHSAIVDITKTGGIGRNGKGCIVLVAAGNSAGRIPAADTAAYAEVIGVGATDCNDKHCWYSVYGPEVDLTAPSGGEVVVGNLYRRSDQEQHMRLSKHLLWTTDITGVTGFSAFNQDPDLLDYTEKMFGTSGACPIAAGVAALILSIEPELTNEEVRHFLERSAKDLGDPGRDDYYGWGRVDARAALDMVLAKRADLNNNWRVDFEDLLILIEFWGTAEPSADIAPATRRDGIVDEQDLELMTQYWQTEIPEVGLIARCKLDEGEGDIAYDSAGTNDGTVHGDPVWQPDGSMVAGALQFDGIDDYVSTDPVLNPADGAFSVVAWIKGGAPGQVLLSQTGAANWLSTDSVDGYAMTELRGSGRSTGGPLLSPAVITDGTWHLIGLVWDGSYRHLYVDGAEVAKDAMSLSGLEDADGGLHIGVGSTLASGTFFSGLIDDVRIYGTALSAGEVAALMQ
ncbi:MAG: S8 family serine peptidase [Phycisphaerae bacterium]|nr:S8 family serine peptidase [Phycisphaerae bacterium]